MMRIKDQDNTHGSGKKRPSYSFNLSEIMSHNAKYYIKRPRKKETTGLNKISKFYNIINFFQNGENVDDFSKM